MPDSALENGRNHDRAVLASDVNRLIYNAPMPSQQGLELGLEILRPVGPTPLAQAVSVRLVWSKQPPTRSGVPNARRAACAAASVGSIE